MSARLTLCVFVLAGLCAAQTTWFVDQAAAGPGLGTASNPFPTIAQGINAASNGDVVEVAPGTYAESVDFGGRAIILRAPGGANQTFIDGNGITVVGGLVIMNELGGAFPNPATLDGFTVRNAGPGNFGVLVAANSAGGIEAYARIENCRIEGNGSGLGYDAANIALLHTTINNNLSRGIGPFFGGVVSAPSLVLNAANSSIVLNGNDGIRVAHQSSGVTLTSCTLSGNGTTGLFVEDAGVGNIPVAFLDSCIVNGNQADGILAAQLLMVGGEVVGNNGHGVRAAPTGVPTTIAASGGTRFGGNGGWGVLSDGGTIDLEDCVIDANFMGGVSNAAQTPAAPPILNLARCDVRNNLGTGVVSRSLLAQIEHCVLRGNADRGLEVVPATFFPGTTVTTNCSILNNAIGASFLGGETTTFRNTLFFGNTTSFEFSSYGGSWTLDSCALPAPAPSYPMLTVLRLVHDDPRLAAAPAPSWRLLADSPLIEAGTTLPAGATDIEGDPRPFGLASDIGADEFVCPSSELCLSATQPIIGAPIDFRLQAPTAGAGAILLADIALATTPLGNLGTSGLAFTPDLFALVDFTGLVGPGIVTPFTDSNGRLDVSFPIPNDPALMGVQIHLQGFALDANAPNGLFLISNLRSLRF